MKEWKGNSGETKKTKRKQKQNKNTRKPQDRDHIALEIQKIGHCEQKVGHITAPWGSPFIAVLPHKMC